MGLFRVLCLLFMVLTSLGLSAQGTKLNNLSPQAEISLLTMGAGNEVYLAFGHSAFRVRDPEKSLDLVFNYGTFSLEDPLFMFQFIKGDLNYYLSIQKFAPYLEWDKETQNRIWSEQVLNLTDNQKQALFTFLFVNAMPENRFYRYDFIKDNCSTRITDALRSVLGDSLKLSQSNLSRQSYRELMDEHIKGRPLWQMLFNLALGKVSDSPITNFEEDWLPFYLRDMIQTSKIQSPEGTKPLVLSNRILHSPPPGFNHDTPWMDPSFVLWPLALLVFYFTGRKLLKGVLDQTLPLVSPDMGERLTDLFIFLIPGLGGAILFYLDFFSAHSAVQENWNLVWMNPLILIAGIFTQGIYFPKASRVLFLATAAGALAALVLWPVWPQKQLPVFGALESMILVRSLWHYLRLGRLKPSGQTAKV